MKKKLSSRKKVDLTKAGLWIVLGLLVVLLPCANAEERSPGHSHGSVPFELEFNNGKKWNADSHTMDYAKQMNALLEQFEGSQEEKTLISMQALGRDLQKKLDKLIQGCTMTGPSHDQLHIWLSAVIPGVTALKNAETVLQGKAAYDQLKPRLREFAEYFTLVS